MRSSPRIGHRPGLGHQDWLPQTLIDSTLRGLWPPLALSRWPLGNRTGPGGASDPAGNTEPKQESLACAPWGLGRTGGVS